MVKGLIAKKGIEQQRRPILNAAEILTGFDLMEYEILSLVWKVASLMVVV